MIKKLLMLEKVLAVFGLINSLLKDGNQNIDMKLMNTNKLVMKVIASL